MTKTFSLDAVRQGVRLTVAGVALVASTIATAPAATALQAARIRESHSTNWSGYLGAHRNHTPALTRVTLNLTVPSMTCPAEGRREASFWTGLGGLNAPLYQDGVRGSCVDGRVRYAAWWEVLEPSLQYMTEQDLVGAPVHAGDRVTAAVVVLGHQTYRVVLINHGPAGERRDKWSYSQRYTSTTAGAPTTAECIVERPASSRTGRYFGLADFGRVVLSRSSCRARLGTHRYSLLGDTTTPLSLHRYDMYSGHRLLAHALPPRAQPAGVTWRRSG